MVKSVGKLEKVEKVPRCGYMSFYVGKSVEKWLSVGGKSWNSGEKVEKSGYMWLKVVLCG